MPDEQQLTLGELGRRIDAGLADIKEDIRALAQRVEGKVDSEVLALQQAAQDERHRVLADQVAALKAARVDDVRRLQETRRWMVGAVIVPLLAILVPLLITSGKL
ncbi:hypothetical protein [Kitasatospora sp. NPDC001175]|uniref:hypothetical protein n=1 Tax=Kitasatospora sp. NPDC001175 TaxID=3157103 RepID=UPI003D013F0B